MGTNLAKALSLKVVFTASRRLVPGCAFVALACFLYGIYGGFVLAPPDYQQGDAFRIIYLHVPSAFMSMAVYVYMAIAAAIALIWRVKLAEMIVATSATVGAWFTFLALVTGALWGKPMWGTWWIWDARLTSELILLFIYLGFIALQSSWPDQNTAGRVGCILILVGIVNIPIIHYSVYWWHTLHQGATLSRFAKPAIAPAMLYPLLAMIAGFFFYYLAVVLMKIRYEILRREYRTAWLEAAIVGEEKRND